MCWFLLILLLPTAPVVLLGVQAGPPCGPTDQSTIAGKVEGEGHEPHPIVGNVAVSLLQAQDAWSEAGLVLIVPHHRAAFPGEEAKLEQVFGDT